MNSPVQVGDVHAQSSLGSGVTKSHSCLCFLCSLTAVALFAKSSQIQCDINYCVNDQITTNGMAYGCSFWLEGDSEFGRPTPDMDAVCKI